MATAHEIETRQSIARGWLEAGIPVASAATMAQVRFGISRSTAYDMLAVVSNTIQASDEDGPDDDLNPLGIVATLQHHFNIAAAQGDVPAMAKLVAAIDKARAWRGLRQERASPQPPA